MGKLKKLLFLPLILGTLLSAEDRSLVGFELGYTPKKDVTVPNASFKIGAESTNYRFFIAASQSQIDDTIDQSSLGLEPQYMFNFSQIASFYIGAETGYVWRSDDSDYRGYIGGESGLDFHLTKKFDIYLGARVLKAKNKESQKSGFLTFVVKYKTE